MFATLRTLIPAVMLTLLPAMAAAQPLKVVATFSILGDFARQVGGDRIALTTLVGPDGDAHAYEPKPADATALSQADVVLSNGLGFEGFLGRLIKASASPAQIVEASRGVKARILAEGVPDPHAFQSVSNAAIYVKAIAEAFCKADREGCSAYETNAAAYDRQLQALDTELRNRLAAIPAERRVVITSHDAFSYLGDAYGIVFLAPEGRSTEAEASAADVAELIRQARDQKASAIFVENISDPRLIAQIAAETGLTLGGTLYSDALSEPGGPAATYVDMMRHNIGAIAAAMLGG